MRWKKELASVIIAGLLFGVLFLVLNGAGMFYNPSNETGSKETHSTNNIRDFEFVLITGDGERPARLSEFLGTGKPVILEVTYIGCGSCEMLHSMGYLRDIYEKYGDQFEIISIFIYNEGREKILKYKENYELNWKYYGYLTKNAADFLISFEIKQLFAHIFFDGKGVERYRNYAQIEFVKNAYPRIIELLNMGEYEKIKEEFGEPIVVIQVG